MQERARPPRRLKKLAQKFGSYSYVDEFLETSSKLKPAHFTKKKQQFTDYTLHKLAQARKGG